MKTIKQKKITYTVSDVDGNVLEEFTNEDLAKLWMAERLATLSRVYLSRITTVKEELLSV